MPLLAGKRFHGKTNVNSRGLTPSNPECTVNLVSTHAYDRLGIAPEGGWAWTVDPKQVAAKAHQAISAGTPFAKADVGTRLAIFLQLRDAFGWEPIRVRLTRNMLKFSPLSKNFHK
jgi:hypothetical protein